MQEVYSLVTVGSFLSGDFRRDKTSGSNISAMLPARKEDVVTFPADAPARLVVIVDAEEEFDWNKPFSPDHRHVTTIAAQTSAHRVFEVYGLVPTYVVDYPVASQVDGYGPLRELFQSHQCEIGAQLHTWVTPPHDEVVCERNSFANNLTVELQRQKLAALTEAIATNFGTRPRVYRAGRYGAGDATPAMLEELGYEVDCSVLPGSSTVALAPSYVDAPSHPYWLAPGRSVLELPVTIAEVGAARRLGPSFYGKLASPVGRKLKVPAIAARLGIIERIRLTPEGSTLEESKRLTRTMLRDGHRVFVVSYHSPSLVPGHTPYVRDQAGLERFFGWLKGYFDFFFGELGGSASTPLAVRDWALQESNRQPRSSVTA